MALLLGHKDCFYITNYVMNSVILVVDFLQKKFIIYYRSITCYVVSRVTAKIANFYFKLLDAANGFIFLIAE